MSDRDSSRKDAVPKPGVSRREWLKRAGMVMGAAVVQPAGAVIPLAGAAQEAAAEPLVALTRTEYDTLDAICARLIPADENGPGAREARAARYIDRGLGGALANSLEAYRAGLAALDAHARESRGAAFRDLPGDAQDAVLEAVQDNLVTGFTGSSVQFFNLVRGHTLQGTFSDPFYGGNANFTGWDMIGYPGVRMAVPENYQQMGVNHPPNRMSAYDFPMFEKGEV